MASLTTRTSQLKQRLLDPKLAEEKLKKQARRRVQIVKEILATEETYHRHLKLMADYFEIPLRAQKLLPNAQISIIFGNIQQLIQVNNELRLHLEEMEVGNAFLQMGHFLKLYSVYAKNHTLAITTLEDVESRNPDLVTFRNRQEDRPEVQMKLNALLITPVQRVPRYKLLLDDLLACTPTTHTDYASLKKAAKQISTVARHINDHIKEHENFQKMIEIQKSLEGSGAPKIVAPGRRFIKEGILKRMSRNGGRSYERMFFLFSDMVMYAKPKLLDNGKHHNSCCCVLPLHHCSVENMFGCCASKDSPMSPDDRGAMFRLSCKDENLLLYSENKETVVEWMKAFLDTIGQVKQSRQTLRKESSAKRPMRRSALQRQCRRDKMKKMRDDLKAADETTLVTDDTENVTCKTTTPASCRPEAQAILKYRKVLKQDGERLFCTPKKRLKLDKEETSAAVAPEDSFELVDDPGMDEFNVTMPRFFKQLSNVSMPEAAGNCDGSTLQGAGGHYERCGTLPKDACLQGLDGEAVKCNTAVDTLKRRLKNSRAGHTIRGSINRSLTRIKRRIRIPLPRKRSKSESAASPSDPNAPLQFQESSTDPFSEEEIPQEGQEQENVYDEISFLPQPDMSLPPMSLNSLPTHPWENFPKRRHISVQSQNMSSLHLQNINNQPEGLMSSLLQPMSMQPQSFCPPQSFSRPGGMPSATLQRFSEPQSLNCRQPGVVSRDMNSFEPQSLRNFQRESLTDEPLSMDYLSVNSVAQETLNCTAREQSNSGMRSLEQPLSMDSTQMPGMKTTGPQSLKRNEDDSDEADRLSFFGMSGQYVRTQEAGFYGPENNFLSLPPVLDARNGKIGPSRYGRSVSCSNQLPVLHELKAVGNAETPFLTESVVKTSDTLSSNRPLEAWGENSNALNHESRDHLPSSTTSEVELEKKESCTIL
ncbi:uncharacterized protein LOC135492188 [Lineus longissimus]|uniref:uncharacterized protein LOC135492188 n=1 Tax=Lineus longissimus TaxID=88925 RepID=UPI00315D8B1E